jgi:hypothetical protein
MIGGSTISIVATGGVAVVNGMTQAIDAFPTRPTVLENPRDWMKERSAVLALWRLS